MCKEEVVDRLLRRFGPGEKKPIRMALYERLGGMAEADEEVLHIISEVAEYAMGAKRDKGHCFCFCIIRRLKERGFLPRAEL